MKKLGLLFILIVAYCIRVESFDASDFDNADTEEVDTSGCPPGHIQISGDSCLACSAGTYANTEDDLQECSACSYDTYSGDEATECTACDSGLGTLEEKSRGVSDCIEVCMVPNIKFVKSASPESRVAEGGDVEIICKDGYYYGNSGSQTVACSSSTNNFPASCRKVTISATESTVKAGESGVLSCVVESHDVGTAIQWFKDDSAIALTSDDTAYTIVTTLASGFEADSVTKISISTLTILNFDSSDVGSYSCRFLYPDPILADQSPEHALEILDITETPSAAQIVSEAASLQLIIYLLLSVL